MCISWKAISEKQANMKSVEEWREIIGDCLFEGMETSIWRKEEEGAGCTSAIKVSSQDENCDSVKSIPA
jgi:hypothetical protein